MMAVSNKAVNAADRIRPPKAKFRGGKSWRNVGRSSRWGNSIHSTEFQPRRHSIAQVLFVGPGIRRTDGSRCSA